MQRGLDQPFDAAQQIDDLKTSALAKVPQGEPAACHRFWDSLSDGDLLHYTDDELAWQTECIVGRDPGTPTQVFVRHQGEHHCTEVLVYDESHARLFVPLTAALARLGANVLYARITRDPRPPHPADLPDNRRRRSSDISEHYALEEMRTTLQNVAQAPGDFDRPVLRQPKRRTRHFDLPTEIEFVQRETPPETRINLSTSDHPGLLWTVSRALDSCQVRITQARITTLGAQVQDVFTVTDAESRPIRDPKMQTQISDTLRRHIKELGDSLRE